MICPLYVNEIEEESESEKRSMSTYWRNGLERKIEAI